MRYLVLGIALWAGCSDAGGGGTGNPSRDGGVALDMSGAITPPPTASLRFPLLTPLVRAATPAGLRPTSPSRRGPQPLTLSASDLKSRFFAAGPTDIFDLLQSIDGRISGIDGMSQTSSAACLSQSPVAYSLANLGAAVTMYGRCYQSISGGSTAADPGLVQFGDKDGTLYLYTAIGQGEAAAIVTPIGAGGGVSTVGDGGAGSGAYTVEAWLSVGTLNQATSCGGNAYWDGCSYGVIHLRANPVAHSFEMTVAGVGFGYCGAQLASDGADIYAAGSSDQGSTCGAVDTVCLDAADASSPGTCGAALSTFALGGLGRKAVTGTNGAWAASAYPADAAGSGNLLLDGSSGDAAHFGPSAPTPGVGSF